MAVGARGGRGRGSISCSCKKSSSSLTSINWVLAKIGNEGDKTKTIIINHENVHNVSCDN